MAERRTGSDIADAIARGFSHRASALHRVHHINAASILSEELLYQDNESFVLDLISISRRYKPENMSSSDYMADIDKFLPAEYKDIIITYYYSGLSAAASEDAIKSQVLTNSQLSIIVQTLVLWGKIENQQLCNIVYHGIREITEIINKYGRSKELCDEFLAIIHDVSQADAITKISKLKSVLSESRDAYVHLLGPDPFEIIRRVLEPEFSINSSQLEQFQHVARIWSLDDLLEKCLDLRRARNLEKDRRVIGTSFSENSGSALGETIKHLFRIKASCDDIDGRKITACVLEAYNLDVDVVAWVDWETVYEAIAISERSVGLRDAALHLLMGQRQVAECFPLIALAEGDGAFTSSLRATVREKRIKDLKALVAALSELNGKSRDLVATAILQHDNASELSGLIAYDPPWAKRLIKAKSLSFDARATAFRHDAATEFLHAGVVSLALANEVKSDAISSLRLAYLKGRQQKGLVHLRMNKIGHEVQQLYSEPATLVVKIIDTSNLVDTTTYKHDAVRALARLVTDYVLFTGPDALKTTISDALRHGQLRNRFMQAFDDAILSTSLSVKDVSELYAEIELESHPQNWILKLRQELRATIRDFNESHLSVDQKSSLFKNVLNVTAGFLDRVMFNPDRPSIEFWQDGVERTVALFLSDAQVQFGKTFAQFGDRVRRQIEGIPNSKSRRINAAAFREALAHNIDMAVQECIGWIAVSRDENLEISFQDLVQLCLVTHSPGSAGKFQVKASVSEYRKSGIVKLNRERVLSAIMFEPLETICKNLIGNCFEHSGLGRNVSIDLELIVGQDKITLRCANTLSIAKYRGLSKSARSMQNNANASSLLMAGEDKSSGLAKIAWACNRFFDARPAFKIFVEESPLTFNVSIDVKVKHAVFSR